MVRKKKGAQTNPFIDACKGIISENKNLDVLFAKLDNVLEYTLQDTFNKVELFRQLMVLGGADFASVIIFCFDKDDITEVLKHLEHVEIEQNLIEKLKFILAKFGPRYTKIIKRDFNKYGWRNAGHSIIHNGDSILLEFNITLNDDTILMFRDDPNSMLYLASVFVDGLIQTKAYENLNDEFVADLSEKVKQLSSNIQIKD